MFKTLQGRSTGDFPAGFATVLESWFAVIHAYEKDSRIGNSAGDAIYWYTERANVGAFAAALARLDCSTLEEYNCAKGHKAEPGRADLSFFWDNRWYLVEAKQKWVGLVSCASRLSGEALCKDAEDDARRTKVRNTWSVPIGLTFVVPHVAPNYRENITQYVVAAGARLQEDTYCDFWAYCAPGSLRELKSPTDGNYYPMVIMLGKRVPEWSSTAGVTPAPNRQEKRI